MQATPVAELNANIIKAETLPETMNCSDEGASKFTMALGRPNAIWAGPVSTLRWVQLSAYAADGKPETYSKGHTVQRDWKIVR